MSFGPAGAGLTLTMTEAPLDACGWAASASTRDAVDPSAVAESLSFALALGAVVRSTLTAMTIKLNGDPHELPGPMSVTALLDELAIDARRVAVELNMAVVKKAAYDSSVIGDGDEVEIVNFVGGG